jgi:Zn-dependent protease with chaperone function
MRAGFAMGRRRRGRAPKLLKRFEARQLPGYGLYAITLFCHLLSAFARGVSVYLALSIIGIFSPWSIPAEHIGWVVGFGPLVLSFLSMIFPPLQWIMGYWWEMDSGGRRPTPDELEAYERALDAIALEDQRFKSPRHWFVAEEDGYNAAVYAHSLCVTRGLLESREAAPAFISHEYPHLRLGDGRMLCALDFLVLRRIERPKILPLRSTALEGLLWVASGSAVDWFFASSWDTYLRSREYVSDNYTIRVGQGPAFARSLRRDVLPYERPIRRMRISAASHPYTKERMARLEAVPGETAGVGL